MKEGAAHACLPPPSASQCALSNGIGVHVPARAPAAPSVLWSLGMPGPLAIKWEEGTMNEAHGLPGDRLRSSKPSAKRRPGEPELRAPVEIMPDPASLARIAAGLIADIARRALVREGSCVLALSGGTTPIETYRSLARHHRASVPWHQVRFVWGDERMVPPDHEDSNYGMARRELLDPLQVPAENVLPIPTGLGSAEEAADAYQARLEGLFPTREGPPRLDLVLLGLGEDGHTASLMPGCSALQETERWAAPCRTRRLAHPRVTLTLPVLNAARNVLFLVVGERKANVVRQILEGPSPSSPLPAQAVRPTDGELRWMVDEAAAGALNSGAVAEQRGESPRRVEGRDPRRSD
jgi:6-phosphogluconolactonase